MTDQENRKSGGGKLSRSVTVTVRLDPKLRYLAELAARKQRRTLSSYIEWAIEDSLKAPLQEPAPGMVRPLSLVEEAHFLWDVDEAERFAKLATRYPNLLTHEEQVLWKLVFGSLELWRSGDGMPLPPEPGAELDFSALRRNWTLLVSAAAAGKSADEIAMDIVR